jgi:GntR family transcriptional regulator
MDFSGVGRGRDKWLHEQVAEVIEKAVASGELRPGQMLPSEQEIVYRARVSRWTARRAVALLREQGTIYSRAHLGSFVSERSPGSEGG